MFMLFLAMNFGRQEATDCSVASSSSDFIKEVGFADNIDNKNSRLTDVVDVNTNNALCLMKVCDCHCQVCIISGSKTDLFQSIIFQFSKEPASLCFVSTVDQAIEKFVLHGSE